MQNKIIKQEIKIYNTKTRKKEDFKPINSPFVGMYVCGPTVYGTSHLGHARPAITFDVIFRYLKYLGYKVRYVRNITDVGHLENDGDTGEDKIAKKAKLDELEPMEVVHHYTNLYHESLRKLNCLSPSIEPRATGHIIEQKEMVQKIIDNGFAYEANGSVYFDVQKYNEAQKENNKQYGDLSGRVLDDLKNNSRKLDGQDDKKNPFDFAIWKKASAEHIMRWASDWSEGFPGWHLECSVMSTKYLGQRFDIHGGGMDLIFPHHECEIAQSVAANGEEAVKYWIHNNMITINGQKMGKSLNNFISLKEFFEGTHSELTQAYSPMTIRFFILQAQYRSTVDFSNEALQAAEKGYNRLFAAMDILDKIISSESESTVNINEWEQKCFAALNDDFNTPILIANLFEAVKMINNLNNGKDKISEKDLSKLKKLINDFTYQILGLLPPEKKQSDDKLSSTIELLISLRAEAKKNKDWAQADKIRDELNKIGIIIKDVKDGCEWEFKNQ